MQDQILGEHPWAELVFHPDPTHLELVHRQALAGEDIAHLTGPDPEGDGPEGPMRGRVRVTTGHCHSGLRETELRRNHMHDSLATTAKTMQGDAVVGTVSLQCAQHLLCEWIRKRPGLTGGWNNVIHRGHGALRTAHSKSLVFQGREGLRTGHLMNQVQADEQLSGSTRKISDAMQIPNLVVKGPAAHSRSAVNIQP